MKPGGRIAPMPVGRAVAPPDPPLPHIFKRAGLWWCSPNGCDLRPPHAASRPTFREACHLAMLAAICSGAWRA